MNSSSCRSVKSSVRKCTVSSSFLIRLFSCSTSFPIVFFHVAGFTKGAIIINVTTGHRFPTILTMPYRLVMCSENGLVHWLLSILFAIEEFHLQTAFPLGSGRIADQFPAAECPASAPIPMAPVSGAAEPCHRDRLFGGCREAF